jgi:hypothetical protein
MIYLAWAKSLQNFKIYQPNVFYVHCNDVTQTQTESGTEVLQMGDFQKNEDFSFSENNLNIK